MTKQEILSKVEPRTVKGIWILNSWGKEAGSSGWQFLSENYIKSGYLRDCFGILDNSLMTPIQSPWQTVLYLLQVVNLKLQVLLDSIRH